MLGKLLKYEMKMFGRILLPLYGLLIAIAIITGLSLAAIMNNVLDEYLMAFMPIVYGVILVAVGVMTIVLLINSFYKNLLGREGYLMFSLPVSTNKLISAKVISNVIWIILSVVAFIISAVALACTMVLLSGEDPVVIVTPTFEEIVRTLGQMTPTLFINILLGIVVVIVLMALMIIRIYAAMAIGSQWNEHRIIGSILAYGGFQIAEAVIMTILGMTGYASHYIFALLNRPFDMDGVANPFGFGLLIMIVGFGIVAAIYWFVTWYFLEKRLNLE
ncbi:MAG: hypothetical protein ACI4WQ_10520 [Sharpea porci]